MDKKPLPNKVTIYWDMPSYSVLQAAELKNMPDRIKEMLLDTLLEELNIPMRSK